VTVVDDLYDPASGTVQDDPYPIYRLLRDEHPVYRVEGRGVYAISRFADVEAALKDPATFSSARSVSLVDTPGMVPTLLTMDPPRHDQLRKLASRAFTPRRIADLEPRIRRLARELLDGLVADRFDAMAYAGAFPAMVIASLLGVPADDHERFRAWVEAVITLDPADLASADGLQLGELLHYLNDVIAEREREREDDLLSALLDAEVDGERLAPGEVLGFALLLLGAGFETTKNLIGNGIAILAGEAAVRDHMRADGSFVPAVVEEVLRYESPVAMLARWTTTAVELHGTLIPADTRVLLLYASANRDEHTFREPDRFDPDRASERHLAFGYGIHYCLGAALARLEGRVAFEELLRVVPHYDVADSVRQPSPYIRGYRSLTLTVTAG
jgi:cytochrome P450